MNWITESEASVFEGGEFYWHLNETRSQRCPAIGVLHLLTMELPRSSAADMGVREPESN